MVKSKATVHIFVVGDSMKQFRHFVDKTKRMEEQFFLKQEKVTIIDQEKVFIQNYSEILEISESSIRLKNMTINGNNLRMRTISQYFMEIEGTITGIELGGKR